MFEGSEYIEGSVYIFLFIFVVSFVASLLAINEFIKVGRTKGHSMDNSDLLWFIGVFVPLGPLAVGLYVMALPDRSQPTTPTAAAYSGIAGLPSIDGTAPTAPAPAAPQQPSTPQTPSDPSSL